jgi:hypothetical protein
MFLRDANRLVTFVASAGVALLAACGGSGTPSATQPAPGEAATASSAAPPSSDVESTSAEVANPAAVPELLDFSAPLVGGGEFDARTLAGKSAAFWFWAPT